MRSREEQAREHEAVLRADRLQRYAMTEDVLGEYGRWVASLAPWDFFVTLTHDPRRLAQQLVDEGAIATVDAERMRPMETGITIVGLQRHRREVRRWFYDDVRRFDHRAQFWGETELHATGQAHEHALLRVAGGARVLSMRQAWFERAGYAMFDRIEDATAVAAYVAKYTGKAAASEPHVYGFAKTARYSYARGVLGIDLVVDVP